MASQVIEALTEDECYLFALLQDHSGIDQAEFLINDPSGEEGCFRAWAFQWAWWRCRDTLQVDCCARSVGKTKGIMLRALAFPLLHPGHEMVITAPELIHLEPICSLIESQIYSTRFYRSLIPGGRGAVTHRPFQVNFSTGSRIIGRIPQRDGRGAKGLHPLILEQDEAQDYPHAGFVELTETLKRGEENAIWRSHGVTRGSRDDFYDMSQDRPDNQWTVHRFAAQWRPNWTDEERQEKIKQYGGRDDPDYRRNILGLHGDITNPILVTHKLFACADSNELSDYNLNEYYCVKLKSEVLEHMGENILSSIAIPYTHLDYLGAEKSKKPARFWAGMDIGFCVDEQTEILTQRGWLKYNEVQIGDHSLSINPETGLSEWGEISDIYREHKDLVPMVAMKGQSFDAFTTPHHRWLVKQKGWRKKDGPIDRGWRWKTTETLNREDYIPWSVPRGDCPQAKIYTDDFVELMAWFWTEGEYLANGGIRVCQSQLANPENTNRIRQLMIRMFGEPARMTSGPPVDWDKYDAALEMIKEGRTGYYIWKNLGVSIDASNRWRNGGTRSRALWSETIRPDLPDMVYFQLNVVDAQKVKDCTYGPEKAVRMEFLTSLTKSQLELYIDISIKADGWVQKGKKYMEQHSLMRTKMFEAACILAGKGVSTVHDTSKETDRWHTTILVNDSVSPANAARQKSSTKLGMKIENKLHQGVIWCPKIANKNWLARRNGSVYFTGNTIDPSEILVFVEYMPNKSGETSLKLLTRVQLVRMSHHQQVAVILHLIDFYRPMAFSLDKSGLGLPLFQDIQEQAQVNPQLKHVLDIIKGYNFSEKVPVDLDMSLKTDPYLDNDAENKQRAIKKNVKEASTDVIRGLVDSKRLEIPWDRDLLRQLEGGRWTNRVGYRDQYGHRKFSAGDDHLFDACRMAVMGWSQYGIEQLLKPQEFEPVFDSFVSF